MRSVEDRIRTGAEALAKPTPEQTARSRTAFLTAADPSEHRPAVRRRTRFAFRWVLAAAILLVAGGASAGYAIAAAGRNTVTHYQTRIHTLVVHTSQVTNPGFVPQPGWYSVDTQNAQAPEAPVATAANVPFSPQDFNGSNSSIPTQTLVSLPPQGIVIQATFYIRGQSSQVDAGFPPASTPFSLAKAITTSPIEGSPMSVGYRRLLVSANGYDVDISVFFGTKHPTVGDLNAAQRELTGLILPSSPTSRR